ncbi:MAG TPA: ABC transporter substrate-binding protein [Candidatus Binatia bacterium]|nr:ABC transporter substrate-binding protein [Candidatus Binatia bacterium]
MKGSRFTISVLAACTLLAVFSQSTEAQPPQKAWKVGFLIASSAKSQAVRLDAFKVGLRKLGYIDGQNINLFVRSGEGKADQLQLAAAELVSLRLDVIVSGGPTSTRALKAATRRIPIITTLEGDPIGAGLITSLACPGGNITGLSILGPELSGKRLEILKAMVPGLSRVAVLESADTRRTTPSNEVDVAAEALSIEMKKLQLRASVDIEPAFQAAMRARAGAVLAQAAAVLLSHRIQVAELAVKYRLPVIFPREEFIEAGGLAVYAASTADLSHRAAMYVDKILKGANTAELPVEQPTKFELVINLKTAKQIGLTIPPHVLARADRVIR